MKEFLGGSLNIAVLSVFYTSIGGLLSYVLGYLFDDCDEVWKKRSLLYKISEISLQLFIFGSIAFWISRYITIAAPIFEVSKELDHAIDTYISGLFFAYAMFLFLDHLSQKIKCIYEDIVGPHIKKILPGKGYLLEGTLHYA